MEITQVMLTRHTGTTRGFVSVRTNEFAHYLTKTISSPSLAYTDLLNQTCMQQTRHTPGDSLSKDNYLAITQFTYGRRMQQNYSNYSKS